jgi:hypothetical protein
MAAVDASASVMQRAPARPQAPECDRSEAESKKMSDYTHLTNAGRPHGYGCRDGTQSTAHSIQ